MKIPYENYKRATSGKFLSTLLDVVFSLPACGATAFAQTISFSAPTLNFVAPGQQVLFVSLQALGQAPAGGLTVALESLDPSVAQVPQSVTIPDQFQRCGLLCNSCKSGFNDDSRFQSELSPDFRTVTVGSAQTAQRLRFRHQASPLRSGGQQEMAVVLSTPAPAGGLTVLLASINTSIAQVPVGVTIPANATTAGFFVTGVYRRAR